MSPMSRERQDQVTRNTRHQTPVLDSDRSLRQNNSPYTGAVASSSRPADSWIEVPSRASPVPNNSQRHPNPAPTRSSRTDTLPSRRPYDTSNQTPVIPIVRRSSTDGSSQEEFEESESESDRVMTSSSENVPGAEHNGRDRALDRMPGNGDCFTPQPNAFSHPPSSLPNVGGMDSYFPVYDRDSQTALQRSSRPPPPSTRHSARQTDHDEALRASLTTLLSCAAAARGLPKSNEKSQHQSPTTRPAAPAVDRATRAEAGTFRMVSDPALMNRSSRPAKPQSTPSSDGQTSMSTEGSKKGKKRTVNNSSKERRAVKRLRSTGIEEMISPTLFTWLVSAGVLVAVSALSFTAGYGAGREAGRFEAQAGWSGGDMSMQGAGRQHSRTGLGLRRRLWNGVVTASA